MKISPTNLFYIFILSIFLLGACVTNEADKNTNLSANQAIANNSKIPAKDNVEELERIIKLPFQPTEATWREVDLNAKKLIVVLKFTSEDAHKIVEQVAKYKPAVASDIDAEDWFPAELVAQSQLSGDENLNGTSYAANDFLQTPFTDGKITRINNTDYFVLELTSP